MLPILQEPNATLRRLPNTYGAPPDIAELNGTSQSLTKPCGALQNLAQLHGAQTTMENVQIVKKPYGFIHFDGA